MTEEVYYMGDGGEPSEHEKLIEQKRMERLLKSQITPAEDQDDEIAGGLYPCGGRSGTWTDPECPQPACADLPAAQLAQSGRCGGPR
jgi:hypothetical protein